ncbi:hypothetical protein BD309DRAFT_854175 [Dichomitus squalens]|uniref:Uncharacterized protein n=1 Tax=Dichomitus squalens TaxID=114155 RepID=A0A4Q9QD76_9APHY|nr:uncharacterized protein DICSQDRAFT_46539 [Dichomitus squalens LYAD-421 SS1]EJF66686.1 hypothetical protein DICSQDRAFT_46539 [Dichomitus squalens LYAD-421 SS1]TBU35232.1 hypothetical protein BD311DRAFT_773373 [Dichomitus squalens]TBU48348.1 hypothetical protein BD309DRAFT_854175 [Dichomitus squalens]TBU65061.1 hypothetical protein BD310DRAFT_805305 [Dichomitus squalens]
MGSLCSKSGTVTGGHQVLGSAADSTAAPSRPDDPRRAAAEAAERRQREASTRGVQSKNPTAGRLAAKLEAQKSSPRAQEQEQPERLVVSAWQVYP